MSSAPSSTILDDKQTSDRDLGIKRSAFASENKILQKSNKRQILDYSVSNNPLYHCYIYSNIFCLVSVTSHETEAGAISYNSSLELKQEGEDNC